MKKIIVGITGASGVVYGVRLLEALKSTGIETHLVVSKAAQLTLSQETSLKATDLQKLADYNYQPVDIGASIASGSFRAEGMIVAPCSVKTMSEIATGVTSGLISRAADVCLKERRKLVLMVRESPLHLGHLRTMAALAEMGAVIAPPLPAFYPKPENIDTLINHNIGRILDLFEVENSLVERWKGLKPRHKNKNT